MALDAHWGMVKAIFGSASDRTPSTTPRRGMTAEQYQAFSKRINSRYQRRGRKPGGPARAKGGAGG